MDLVFENGVNLQLLKDDFVSYFKSFEEQFSSINNRIREFKLVFDEYVEYAKDKLMSIDVRLRDCSMYLAHIRDYLSKLTEWYYPEGNTAYPNQSDYHQMRTGWRNFFTSFAYKSFQDVLLDVHQQIEDLTNPLSDKNKGEFDNNMEKLKSDTAVGSALELKDGVQNLYSNISGASPTASLNVNLLPVKFYGASVPAKTIKIDFSWYAPYRDTALSLWRFFLWTAYLFVLFKQIPSILQGFGLISDHRIEMQDIAINDHMADDYYQMLVNNNGVDDIRPKS